MQDTFTITNAKYVAVDGVNTTIIATIDGVYSSVPLDTGNKHYAEILRQIEAGTLTIEEAE